MIQLINQCKYLHYVISELFKKNVRAFIWKKKLILKKIYYKGLLTIKLTRKSVDGEPSHIPALIKANRIEASYFLAYVAKYG